MTHQSFSSPSTNPLQRLHVYDSLMMNADRWQFAHEYHRRRQNVVYQSLNEPGIVCGLGVRVIAAPTEAPGRFKDARWLEIQPGIAIDVEGNPIIVDPSIDRTFRIATSAPITGIQTVYLVVSYVEPQQPSGRQTSDPVPTVREWFRFDEKTSPPSEKEIELCRILLQPGKVKLQNPRDVFFPDANEIDLRYRTQAKARPKSVVKMAATVNTSDRTCENLSSLMESIAGLYPSLQGTEKIGQVYLQPDKQTQQEITDYDLLYLPGWQTRDLYQEELETLRQYLATGGVVLIEVAANNPILMEDIKSLLQDELDISLLAWEGLDRKHPLRKQPFLFAATPQAVQVWCGDGVILIAGDLSGVWGLDEQLLLSRDDIRTAQEFGVNIVNFALLRRGMRGLLV